MYKTVDDFTRIAYQLIDDYTKVSSKGTSLMGSIHVRYKDLERVFGPPQESDGCKVSGKWTFYNDKTGAVFTLYDWKETSLYSADLPSVEEFRNSDQMIQFHIGGNFKESAFDFYSFIQDKVK